MFSFKNALMFQVYLNYSNGELTLTVDYKYKTAQLFGLQFQLGDKVIIGSGGKSNLGMAQKTFSRSENKFALILPILTLQPLYDISYILILI